MFVTELNDHDADDDATATDAASVAAPAAEVFVGSTARGRVVVSLRSVELLSAPSVWDAPVVGVVGAFTATADDDAGWYAAVARAAALTTTGPWMAYRSCAPFTSTVSLSTIDENCFRAAITTAGGPQTLTDRL
jgi:hypothetical protein